ncbi:Flagellum site-determining protein YlxH [Pirellulimonas nuda]|uniref:Flagellum site-determining protein YlxH n=1 Tax=Pirellulimonas nuda TaxID=2528009 RepID=A0A518D895_9BACT|nr:MinD/ParA family protein [Pirellulimonas nuda]QDU87688.1 Flagellum site-determining protein YlxH [Pirellulimonas nuda]
MTTPSRSPDRDQADRLRALVAERRAPRSPESAAPVLFAGAKGGVGVTSLCWRAAQSLAGAGTPVLAVDASLDRPDLTVAAGASRGSGPDLSDVFALRSTLAETSILVAPGARVAPGQWGPESPPVSLEQTQTLATQLAQHDQGLTLLDAGAGLRPLLLPLWRSAGLVLLVTTPDELSVLNAYATLKLAQSRGVCDAAALLVNRCYDQQEADATHDRLAAACGRHLGFEPPLAGWIAELPRGSLRSPAAAAAGSRLATYVRYALRPAGRAAA